MARFLSPEWLAELDAAVSTHPDLAELAADVRLVVEQRVTGSHGADGDQGDEGEVIYHLVIDHGAASVRVGPADDPTVTFTQDVNVARAIASGQESAQRAFMNGGLRLGGDLQSLLTHQAVLSRLGDAFATVRRSTDFGPGDLVPDEDG